MAPVQSVILDWDPPTEGDRPDRYYGTSDFPNAASFTVPASQTTYTFEDAERQQYTATLRSGLEHHRSTPVSKSIDLRDDSERCEAPTVTVTPSAGITTTRSFTITLGDSSQSPNVTWTVTGPDAESGTATTVNDLEGDITVESPGTYTFSAVQDCGTSGDANTSEPGTTTFTVEQTHNCLKPLSVTGNESDVSLTTWRFVITPDDAIGHSEVLAVRDQRST